jgi:hypothetical protein
MRDIDLSSEVKIFPTSFAGARFVPYPPCRKKKAKTVGPFVNEQGKEQENPRYKASKDLQ